MGIDPDTTFWNFDIYIHMIKNLDYAGYIFTTTPKEFSMWYAHYALWGTVMPTHPISYITIDGDDLKGYGHCSFREEHGTHYLLEFQKKDNFIEHFSIIANGFTKEEIVLTEEAIDRAVVRTLTELFDLSMASWQCRAVCGCTHLRLRYLYGGNGRCNAWQIRAGRTPSDYHAKRR